MKNLTLAFAAKVTGGPGRRRRRGGPARRRRRSSAAKATASVTVGGATQIKGAVLSVNGVLYVTAPDNVWALDAHDGHEIWHYFWKTKGGTHIGNRGVAMWGNYLYFVTPDDYFVSLDARTGKERWHKEAAPLQPAVLPDVGADDDRQPHHRRHRQRSRLARLPDVVRSGDRRRSSGGSTPCR